MMGIACMIHASATMTVIGAFTHFSCHTVSSAPVKFRLMLLRPKRIQVFKMASTFIVMDTQVMEVCWVNFSDTKSSWAELNTLDFSATSCSNIIEIFTTCFQMIYKQTTTMLPCILYLVIAKPGISIERTFFILFIEA